MDCGYIYHRGTWLVVTLYETRMLLFGSLYSLVVGGGSCTSGAGDGREREGGVVVGNMLL